jgi:type IV secretion system protein VirB5
MKKKILTLSICAALLTGQHQAYATGIPTVDVASIAQMVLDSTTRAAEFAETIQAARQRLEQMRNSAQFYQDMVEGAYSFEDVLNESGLSEDLALSTWSDAYDNVSRLQDLRDDFGLNSSDPYTQSRWDSELLRFDANQKLYDSTVKRNEKMLSLLTQFSSATTPAQKESLANAIHFEQLQLQNDVQMVQAMSNLLKQREEQALEANSEEIRRQFMNEGFSRND